MRVSHHVADGMLKPGDGQRVRHKTRLVVRLGGLTGVAADVFLRLERSIIKIVSKIMKRVGSLFQVLMCICLTSAMSFPDVYMSYAKQKQIRRKTLPVDPLWKADLMAATHA